MEEITYHLATENDVALLTELRIAFMEDLKGKQEEGDVAFLSEQMNEYFKKGLAEKNYISWYAKSGEEVIAVGGIVLRRQPGNFRNPSGKVGYIVNMYTLPHHRRKGLATILLNKIINSAKEAGYHCFELQATPAGVKVYEKEGFELHEEPTYKRFDTL
jgi:GNAT superfamily N-acetyltransferase